MKNTIRNLLTKVPKSAVSTLKRVGENFKGNTMASPKFASIAASSDSFFPEHQLAFVNGKYPLIQEKSTTTSNILSKIGLVPFQFLFGYWCLKSVIFFRPFRALIWGGCSFYSMYANENLKKKENYVLKQINLLRNGKEVEIFYLDYNETVKIPDIRRLTAEEAKYFSSLIPFTSHNYLPLVVKNKFYVIPKNFVILDGKVLSAISQGKEVYTEDSVDVEESIENKM